jgi:hypothetical protein
MFLRILFATFIPTYPLGRSNTPLIVAISIRLW